VVQPNHSYSTTVNAGMISRKPAVPQPMLCRGRNQQTIPDSWLSGAKAISKIIKALAYCLLPIVYSLSLASRALKKVARVAVI
jgi:hypothetical protein